MTRDLPSTQMNSSVICPKLYVISMVRNEADVFSPFLCQLSQLFDKVLLVDHGSTDGTRQILDRLVTEDCEIEVFNLRQQGYYQAEVSTLLAHKAFQEGADWCFFLDADEFIDVDDKAALRRLLGTFDYHVMTLPWANLVPTELGTFTSFNTSQAFRWDGSLSRYCKVAIASSYASLHPNFYVHQGNHAVSASHGEDPAAAHTGIRLFHIPIRSLDRLTYKLSAGVESYNAKRMTKSAEGSHWFELHDRVQRGEVDMLWLNSVIAHYGEPLRSIEPVDPVASNWDVVRLPGNYHLASPPDCLVTLKETVAADDQRSWTKTTSVGGPSMQAELRGEEIIVRPQPMQGSGTPYNGRFDSLPSEEGTPSERFSYRQLTEAVSSAFDPIQVLVASAWSEHAPTLNILFSLLRPRRYVEIGTHWGMSLFTACQASDSLGIGTQCIGVDAWLGDKHAGYYDDYVFEQFSWILKTRYPQQMYLRSLFDDAAPCFAENSIDLLLIDGLHTYDAVKHDFDVWLPKMSSRGVILFHDTNVYERDFGVWRLWDELKARYPHFQAPHCNGLGVIFVGEEPSPFAAAQRSLEQDRDLETLVISFLARVGAMSVNQTKLSEELKAAKAEQERLAGVEWAIRHSTSWKVSRPVRVIGRTLKRVRSKR